MKALMALVPVVIAMVVTILVDTALDRPSNIRLAIKNFPDTPL
jgi:hypothetical protein